MLENSVWCPLVTNAVLISEKLVQFEVYRNSYFSIQVNELFLQVQLLSVSVHLEHKSKANDTAARLRTADGSYGSREFRI